MALSTRSRCHRLEGAIDGGRRRPTPAVGGDLDHAGLGERAYGVTLAVVVGRRVERHQPAGAPHLARVERIAIERNESEGDLDTNGSRDGHAIALGADRYGIAADRRAVARDAVFDGMAVGQPHA